MNARLNSIAESHTETFEWLFKDVGIDAGGDSLDASQSVAYGLDVKWDNFAEWLKSGEELYLIEGKAGSGKSTLMKFIYNHQKLAGDVLQRAYKGLLATLSFQIIEHVEDSTVELALEGKVAGSKRSLVDWSESALEDLLFSLLSVLQTSSLVLIDGLHEFDQDDRPSRLVALLKKLTSYPGVKLCTSSRPTTWLDWQLSSAKGLKLQDLTRSDILKYAEDVLQEEVGFYVSDLENDGVQGLVYDIQDKAEGVFLWVKYALHSIAEGISGMDDLQALKARLLELPKGMYELYEHTWRRHENYNNRHREEAALCFYCACLSPLSSFEFAVMMDPVLLQHYRDNATPIDENLVTKTCAQMEQKLKIRTAGLLVCERSNPMDKSGARVSYLHRTVHDFLYETQQGRTIVALSNQTMQNMFQSRIYALVALFVQGHLQLNFQHMEQMCKSITH
ncbi:hypothetical protein LTR70_008085 [Exophiala xenobiotica]|uniref:NACHT domain-containing protein n=1 Tax=Lithohypha guttulata TaxID=1690604 RepID=A0ABR0K584_9EURO|nr:hypothetical protein LTR24_007202 [Lithohypha guttulata]KAK5312642.1 hypothetical protein LTR70_008085 [Exophiala xenobiotica]